MKKVVIVGGGFAGMNAYLEFHKRFHKKPGEIEVTMISERDTFLFTPLIHEVATGTLSPDNVVQSIRQVAQCCLTRFIEGTVTQVDVDGQKVTYKTGKRRCDGHKHSCEYKYKDCYITGANFYFLTFNF